MLHPLLFRLCRVRRKECQKTIEIGNRPSGKGILHLGIWESEGRPEGRADDHWQFASIENSSGERVRDDEHMDDEEKILAGRPDANIPALLTKDVRGG
jgi:Protein of unknown function (DUF2934)